MRSVPLAYRWLGELMLAGLVIIIAFITIADIPRPYPSWPTIGPVPVDPELVFPGLLGVLVLLNIGLDAFQNDTITIPHIAIGVLGIATLWLAVNSLYTLATLERGGVFWGGFFTLISATILAVAVITRTSIRIYLRQRPRTAE